MPGASRNSTGTAARNASPYTSGTSAGAAAHIRPTEASDTGTAIRVTPAVCAYASPGSPSACRDSAVWATASAATRVSSIRATASAYTPTADGGASMPRMSTSTRNSRNSATAPGWCRRPVASARRARRASRSAALGRTASSTAAAVTAVDAAHAVTAAVTDSAPAAASAAHAANWAVAPANAAVLTRSIRPRRVSTVFSWPARTWHGTASIATASAPSPADAAATGPAPSTTAAAPTPAAAPAASPIGTALAATAARVRRAGHSATCAWSSDRWPTQAATAATASSSAYRPRPSGPSVLATITPVAPPRTTRVIAYTTTVCAACRTAAFTTR